VYFACQVCFSFIFPVTSDSRKRSKPITAVSARRPAKRVKKDRRDRPKVRALETVAASITKLGCSHFRALVTSDFAYYDAETADSTAKACLEQAAEQKDLDVVITEEMISLVCISGFS
jgi:hypothetical protein